MIENISMVHLTRENRLRIILSLEVAKKTSQWQSSDASVIPTSEKRVVIDTSNLFFRIKRIEKWEDLARSRFAQRGMLEVVYERLVDQPAKVFAEVGGFLNVDDLDFSRVILKRQNEESISDLIINYDEVCATLQDTTYESYLHG
jgi:LPS sulfotransferase NodH